MPLTEILVAGGGANNETLMEWLAAELPKTQIKQFSEVGVPVSAREGMAFAFLAYLFLHSYALDLTSITGAKCNSILGQLSVP